jgi:lipoprotein-releasing system permease protein
MNLPLRIALKYIFSIRSLHFITIISIISMIGIIVGVSAIIAVMSIFNGFRDFTQNQLIAFDPHIRVMPNKGVKLQNSDSLKMLIEKSIPTKAISSSIDGRIICNNGTNLQVINIIGVKRNEYSKVSNISKAIVLGSFTLKNDPDILPTIVIGSGLSEKLRIMPLDTLTLYSPQILESAIKSFNTEGGLKVVVKGIFQSYTKEYDNSNAFIDFDAAADLFKLSKESSFAIDIKLNNIEQSDEYKKILTNTLGSNYQVLTWYDLHKELFNIMKLERIGTFIVLSLIVLIAVFNILASLTMTVIEKKRDISILLSIGSTEKSIRQIFIYQGIIIGFISSTIGTILGLMFCYGQIHYKWFKMDTTKYLIDAIPISVSWTDVALAYFMSLFLSIIAAYYPSRQAIKISVTNSIRFE